MSKVAGTALLAICAISLMTATIGAGSAGDDPKQILLAHEAMRRTQSDEYLGEVTVTSKNGNVRRKEWKSYHEGHGASSNRLIRFLSPPDVRGVGYLRRQRSAQTFDEWLYLPSMGRERRVVQSDRQAAFVGTDFSFEDLEDLEVLNPEDYVVSMLPERSVDGQACHAIELRPRVRSEYQRKVAVIRKDNYALMVLEYYRKTEKGLSKQLTMLDYHEIDKHQIALKVDMADFRKGSHTLLTLRSVAIDRPQPADRYTIQNLNREEDGGGVPLVPEGRVAEGRVFRPGLTPESRGAVGRVLRPDFQAPQPERRPAFAASMTGYADARLFGYLAKSSGRDSWTEEWSDLYVRATARFWRVRTTAAIRAEANSVRDGPIVFDPADRLPLRSPLSLREASFSVPLVTGIDFQAGRFPVAWGESERLSPADAFLPRDTTDPLSEERLPLWGYQLRGERLGLRFELLAVPTTTPWRLPVLDGRHSPVSTRDVFLVDVTPPSPVPKKGFEAIRVSGTAGAWDIGVWARTGIRPAPIIEPHEELETVVDGNTFVPIGRRYAHENAGGIHISRPWQGWLVEGELGILRSNDPDLGHAVIGSIVGTHPIRNGEVLLTFAFNGIKPPVEPLLLFDRALLPAFILGVKQTETWGTWKVGWVGAFNRVGGVLTGEIVRNLTPVVKFTIGADFPHGDPFSAARAFAGNKRARAAIRWEW